jgi:Lon protease-like protein
LSKEIIKIPLFPLDLVLFPNSKLPLHIFEERYKNMITMCMQENQSFGINLMSNNNISAIGSTADIVNKFNVLPNGEMDIVVKGKARYELKNYNLSSEGYFIGEINYLEDETGFNKGDFNKAVECYNKLIDAAYKGTLEKINPDDLKWIDGSESVSFFMAQKCGLNLKERQQMLEIDSEQERLDYLLNYFDAVMPKIVEADRISQIIQSDGYLQ